MRTISFKIYPISEHPSKEKCFDWIRNNWHDLNSHSVAEFELSLKALQNHIGGVLNYSISSYPCRGEFISLTGYNKAKLQQLNPEDLPLTGVCWDYEIIQAFKEKEFLNALGALHNDTEYLYSNAGLTELCELNDYEFYEDGKIAP